MAAWVRADVGLDRIAKESGIGSERQAMSPSQEGETRAAYVIQRHFRRVRKGYDPAEVDRHLQLVSEWFRTSRAAEKAREVREQSAARERAAADREVQAERFVESSRLEAEATLEGARLRAQADRDAAGRILREAEVALETGRREGEEILARARDQADGLLTQAREEARSVLPRAREDAATLLAQAREEAEAVRVAARGEAAAIVDQARLQAAAADVLREAEERANGWWPMPSARLSVLPRRAGNAVNRSFRAREWRPAVPGRDAGRGGGRGPSAPGAGRGGATELRGASPP